MYLQKGQSFVTMTVSRIESGSMEQMEKMIKKSFNVALTVTILFVIGIPLIPIGAVNKIWALMIIGIVFTAFGFYGIPLFWISYGNKVSTKRLIFAIEVEHIYTVSQLAEQLAKPEAEVRELLNTCFQKCYLVGYRRDGDTIVLNEGVPLAEKMHTTTCPNCGATFSHKGTEAVCPFCGIKV